MQNQQGIQNWQISQNQQINQNHQIMQSQPTYNNHPTMQYQPGMQTQPIIKKSSHEYSPSFPVVYKNSRFMVDPMLLCQTSRKFYELYEPISNGNYKFGPMQLEIACTNFSVRNVDNFLKICQNLPNDVQDSETKEICELAKLFQADSIYNSGVSFVQQAIDPNFFVPDNKYEESNGLKYLYIEPEGNSHQVENMTELQYNLLNDANEASQQPINSGYININTVPSTNNLNISRKSSNNNVNSAAISSNNLSNEKDKNVNSNISSDHSENKKISSISSQNNLDSNNVSSKSLNNSTKDENSMNDENKDNNGENKEKQVVHSVVYQIKIDVPLWKCNKFFLIKDGQIILSAKQKNEYIVIGSGSDVHISSDTSNHVANIVQNEDFYNDVSVDDQKFIVKYVSLGKAGHYSIELSFKHNNNTYYWGPKDPYNNMKNYGYTLKLTGEYNHHPIRSRKNTVLQNPDGQTTFIVRKMDDNFFEAECHPDVPPAIAFVIALSDIVGPYFEFDGQFTF